MIKTIREMHTGTSFGNAQRLEKAWYMSEELNPEEYGWSIMCKAEGKGVSHVGGGLSRGQFSHGISRHSWEPITTKCLVLSQLLPPGRVDNG